MFVLVVDEGWLYSAHSIVLTLYNKVFFLHLLALLLMGFKDLRLWDHAGVYLQRVWLKWMIRGLLLCRFRTLIGWSIFGLLLSDDGQWRFDWLLFRKGFTLGLIPNISMLRIIDLIITRNGLLIKFVLFFSKLSSFRLFVLNVLDISFLKGNLRMYILYLMVRKDDFLIDLSKLKLKLLN